jgi:hypothetical protein
MTYLASLKINQPRRVVLNNDAISVDVAMAYADFVEALENRYVTV